MVYDVTDRLMGMRTKCSTHTCLGDVNRHYWTIRNVTIGQSETSLPDNQGRQYLTVRNVTIGQSVTSLFAVKPVFLFVDTMLAL